MKEREIYKDPLEVICTSDKSSKLIKGSKYFAISIYTNTLPEVEGDDRIRTVYIKNLGGFNTKIFSLLDGSPLHNHPDFIIDQKNVDPDKESYIGQFVKCRFDHGKSLKESEIYYVEDQKITQTKRFSRTTNLYKFKIRGIHNWIASYRFDKISIAEQRLIKLRNLEGIKKLKTGDQSRKFLLYSEKEKSVILLNILTKVLTDINNANLGTKYNLIELMLNKGNNYNITKNEIFDFLNNNILELLKPYKSIIITDE